MDFAGIIAPDGSYSVTAQPGKTNILGGLVQFSYETLTLTSGAVMLSGHATVDNRLTADFSGPLFADGTYDVTATTNLNIAGYAVDDATLTMGGPLDVTCILSLPQLGNVDFQGSYDSADHQWSLDGSLASTATLYGLTLSQASLQLNSTGLSIAATGGLAAIPGLGTASITASMDYEGNISGHFVPDGSLDYSLDGFGLTQGSIQFDYDSSSQQFAVSAQGTASLFGGTMLRLSGDLLSDGSFDLATRTNITLGGLSLDDVGFDLTNQGFTFSGTWSNGFFSAPLNGSVADDGTIAFTTLPATGYLAGVAMEDMSATVVLSPIASSPSITFSATRICRCWAACSSLATMPTATIPSVPIPEFSLGGYPLTNAKVALSSPAGVGLNSSGVLLVSPALDNAQGINFSAQADLPVLGDVDLSGQIEDAHHYSLSAQLSNGLSLGAFTLASVTATLSQSGIGLAGNLDAPVIGNIQLTGELSDASDFSLSAPLSNVTLGGFTLTDDTATLNPTGLVVSGKVHLPVFGNVTLDANIPVNGDLPSLSTNFNSFSILGGLVQFSHETLTLNTDSISLSAQATVAKIGEVKFTGSLDADGNYSVSGTASVNIAGFQVNAAQLTLGSDDIGVDFELPVPEVGDVEFTGSYGTGGHWSLGVNLGDSVQVEIGPVTIKDIGLILSDTSLTLTAVGTVADFDALANAQVTATIYYDGEFDANLNVHVLQIGDFSLGQAVVDLTNHNPQHLIILTVDAVMGIPDGPNIKMDGFIDAKGNYDFTGSATVGLAGVQLANAQFEFTDLPGKFDGLSFSASENLGIYSASVMGSIGIGSQGMLIATETADGHLLGGPSLILSGTIDGDGYYDFTGQARY